MVGCDIFCRRIMRLNIFYCKRDMKVQVLLIENVHYKRQNTVIRKLSKQNLHFYTKSSRVYPIHVIPKR